jgi:putative transposase
MTKRTELQKRGALLHLYNRGNRKQPICEELDDYNFLYNIIKFSFREAGFDLLSFCIMPNHYHILARQRGNTDIGQVMQRIGCGYTKYFNTKYSVSGHLFQGTYKYKFVRDYAQLKIVSKYIEQNPLDIGLPTQRPYFFKNESLIYYYQLSLLISQEQQYPIEY